MTFPAEHRFFLPEGFKVEDTLRDGLAVSNNNNNNKKKKEKKKKKKKKHNEKRNDKGNKSYQPEGILPKKASWSWLVGKGVGYATTLSSPIMVLIKQSPMMPNEDTGYLKQ